jgi:hypothetical protein
MKDCGSLRNGSWRVHFNIVGEHYEVPSLWEIVRDLRKRVANKLSSLPDDVRDGAVLTVSELAENLVKYSMHDPEVPPELSVFLTEESITVRSRNRVASEKDVENVLASIGAIAAHQNVIDLYSEAISTSLDSDSPDSQQGFYRIAAIGGFELEAHTEGTMLTIIAKRSL